MSDNFTTTKASDLLKTTGRALNAEQRVARAEALLAIWFPEFKLMYATGSGNTTAVIQAKINGKVSTITIPTHMLQQADPNAISKYLAEEFAAKYIAPMLPYINAEVVKAISNHAVAGKIDGGKL